MRVLVTGGAGYIGCVVTRQLLDSGHDVVVLDDLSTGHADAVPAGARLEVLSLQDAARLVTPQAGFEAVLHFAAKALVGESVERPELYWHANVVGSLALLEAVRDAGVPRLVFSSTCATYGEPDRVPMDETLPTRPTNPYGASKLAVDMMITSWARAHGLGAVSLRYFNVGGAHDGLGERHATETHLVPIALQVALGQREALEVYGDDYPTPDGTCVRDYIHVTDLGRAHLAALDAVIPAQHDVYNLGTGSGYTVEQVVETVREVTRHPVPTRTAPRRPGDPAVLVATSRKAEDALGWVPEKGLREIVQDAWDFARSR